MSLVNLTTMTTEEILVPNSRTPTSRKGKIQTTIPIKSQLTFTVMMIVLNKFKKSGMLNLSRNKATRMKEALATKRKGMNQSIKMKKGMISRNTTKIDTINLNIEKKSQNMKKDPSMRTGKNTRTDLNMRREQNLKKDLSTRKDLSMRKNQNTKKSKNMSLSILIQNKITTTETNLTTAMKNNPMNLMKMESSNMTQMTMTWMILMPTQMTRTTMIAQALATTLAIIKSLGSTMQWASRLSMSSLLALS